MCVYSMVVDHYTEKWSDWLKPQPYQPVWPPVLLPPYPAPLPPPQLTPEEIADFRKLLERAKRYDADNNEPACELDSKKKKLIDMAKELGVELLLP